MPEYPIQSDARIVIRVPSTGSVISTTGKRARLIRLLILCGERGFNTGEAVSALGKPAPRTAAYVDALKKRGLPIKSQLESISPRVRVARYRLSVLIEVVEDGADD